MPDARLQRTREAYRSDLEKVFDASRESGDFFREWACQAAVRERAAADGRTLRLIVREPSDDDLWGV